MELVKVKSTNNLTHFILTVLCDIQYNLIRKVGDKMSDTNKILQNLKQEMRRGSLVLAVLTQLDKEEYGYSLIELLSDKGFEIEQNTLYPLLRRLETQGLLESSWKVEENRPRRYYIISKSGKSVREELIRDWLLLEKNMSLIIGGY